MTISEGGEANSHSCVLEVTGGRHRGASVSFGPNGCSIGTDVDCDVILSDAGIAGHHVKLLPHGHALLVETGSDFAFVGKTKIPASHGLKTAFPAEFRLGEASFRVSRAQSAKAPGFWSSNAKWIACGVAAIVVAAASVQAVAGVGAGGMGIALTSQKPVVEVSLEQKAPAATATEAVGALSGQLAQAGLGALQIRADGARLLVSGHLTQDEQQKWHSVQEWFDGTYAGRFVLSNMVSLEAQSTPDIRLQAVWLGEKPYMVVAGGRRVYTGESVGNGWVMTAIGNGRIEFRRSSESFSLTF
jgi:hypothetical protein